MGFQPYDVRMYKFDRNDTARVLYDFLLEIENIEHIEKKSEAGFYAITVEQIIKSEKTILTSISQIRTATLKLIDNGIIIKTQIGNKRYHQPSIFYMTEIVNRLRKRKKKDSNDSYNRSKNDNSKSQLKNKSKLSNRNTLHKGDMEKIAIAISNNFDNRNRNLLIDLSKRLIKRQSLIDKGIEKEEIPLSWREQFELFKTGENNRDLVYNDDSEEVYK